MRHVGSARLDKRTKDLVRRLSSEDIAFIDHIDLDRVSAEGLLSTGVEAVVNASPSISGVYPNVGPLLLTRGGVTLVDNVGPSVFSAIRDGEVIEIVDGDIILDGTVVATGTRLTVQSIEASMEKAREGLGDQLDKFARNTLEFLDKEKSLLIEGTVVPETKVEINGRHVLVVVRGYDYQQDLDALKPYIREMRPVLIGVDGGADAIRDVGFTPDIIVGDMDSVSDEVLRGGADLIVHAYADGRCPGMERLDELGLKGIPWPITATSEDLALLLAWESGADLIVAVGTHANLVEYLDKGRKGMASTFLVRLKVGSKLVDAKGVNKLYRTSVGPSHLLAIALAALITISVVILISPMARDFLALALLQFRASLGL